MGIACMDGAAGGQVEGGEACTWCGGISSASVGGGRGHGRRRGRSEALLTTNKAVMVRSAALEERGLDSSPKAALVSRLLEAPQRGCSLIVDRMRD